MDTFQAQARVMGLFDPKRSELKIPVFWGPACCMHQKRLISSSRAFRSTAYKIKIWPSTRRRISGRFRKVCPLLERSGVHRLLEAIETSTHTGLRDRALLGVLAYTFARFI